MYKNILGELLPLHIDSNNFELKFLPLNKRLFVIIFALLIKIKWQKLQFTITT